MKAAKKFLTVMISVLLWAVILAAALFAFTTLATRDTTKVASIAGFTPLAVKSDSMLPAFRAGDLIIIRACDTAELQVGDIICFHAIIENQYALNTHRIAEIVEGSIRSYVTRGDNNPVSDLQRIVDGDIVGKYVGKVPGVGRVLEFLGSSLGFLLVILLPLIAFFIYQIYRLIVISANLKKAAMLEAQQATAESADAEKWKAEAERARAEAAEALAEAQRLKSEAERLKSEAAGTGTTEPKE